MALATAGTATVWGSFFIFLALIVAGTYIVVLAYTIEQTCDKAIEFANVQVNATAADLEDWCPKKQINVKL